ncbi:hypothetical protein Scep_013007 [Stephania cephalantha]|uniref:Exostosin GT47 domain-containing protein n=1 Tax=Stephania cephalantha TaxID=152367 RepID=A0AAP0P841_9MAGN
MSDRPKPRKPKYLSSSSINGETLTLTLTPPLSSSSSALKMPRKSLLFKRMLASIFAISAVFLFFFYAFISPLDRPRRDSRSTATPVKVFVYDLPKKFTHGVVERYLKARGEAAATTDWDLGELKYPGHQHSAEWWLLKDLMRKERSGSAIVRVLDPDEADLFYVPFFSSLSLVVNPNRPGLMSSGKMEYSDEEMQDSLVEWLEDQVYWKRNNGRDHVFVCQDPNALYRVIDRVKNGVLLVSDFGRLRRDQASLVKDVILPYSHRINSFKGDVGVQGREVMLFFMGNRFRKEGGKVRDLLFQVLEKEGDCVISHGTQSRESRRAASNGMHTSKFCLHPAGDTPSACRLFDAIVSLCVPVIVSDYVELPFEDVIDYSKIAIFVDTNKAVMPGYLVKLLRGVSNERILGYQKELKKVKRYFEYDSPNGAVEEIWRQVAQKVPLTKLMINRDKRLVSRDLTEPDCACICSNRTANINLQTIQ